MSLETITIMALASAEGLTVVSKVHERGQGWPAIGSRLDGRTILWCARKAAECQAVFQVQVVGDGQPSFEGGGE